MNAGLLAVRGGLPPLPQAQAGKPQQQRLGCSCRRRSTVRSLQIPGEPAYDDLKLDDAYYKELGIDEDEREAQKSYEPDDIGAVRLAGGTTCTAQLRQQVCKSVDCAHVKRIHAQIRWACMRMIWTAWRR